MNKLKEIGVQLIANIPFILVLAGIASIVYACFLFTEILGWAILGIALIIVAYMLSPTIKGGGD